jgi:FMN-dependent NADH-azoreductase
MADSIATSYTILFLICFKLKHLGQTTAEVFFMKLLYIKCNPKPESQSACLRVGREFVRQYSQRFSGHEVEELNLYEADIPDVDGIVFNGRSGVVSGSDYDGLNYEGQHKVDRINELCDQFLSADRYVIAAPMWSLAFPPKLKSYIDCVVQNGKTIRVTPRRVEGLMTDKPRIAVFIQSCGGSYGNIITSRFNYGAIYLKNLFLFLGMADFIRLPVDGTGMPDIGTDCAISKAVGRIGGFLEDLV